MTEFNPEEEFPNEPGLRMPWGKFKGELVEDLPSSYLQWLAENIDERKPRNRAICLAADEEWRWREANGKH
jgi:hypothetical protein